MFPIEIINKLKALYPDTKKQTVYVTLGRFKEEKFVRQLPDGRYELNPLIQKPVLSSFGGSGFI